jgi:GT2 family glycosyltransferase
MTGNRVSALIPNYNHARYLPQALEAVLSQPGELARVIVIDDGSTDGSLDLLQDYAARHPVMTVLQNPVNMGVVKTMNRLLHLAESEYVYFGAADDFVLPGFFAKCLRRLEEHPTAGLCSANSLLIDADGRLIGHVRNKNVCEDACHIAPPRAAELIREFSDLDLWVCGNAVVYRRSAIERSGGFNEKLEFFCDGFLHKLISLRDGACYLPEFLAVNRVTDRNYSGSIIEDTRRLRQVRRVALDLMTADFGDVFPDWYKQRCKDLLALEG